MTYCYACLHIETGKVIYRINDFHDQLHFYIKLDEWNALGRGQWQYWRDMSAKAALKAVDERKLAYDQS